MFPAALSGTPRLPQQVWEGWNEVYRNTYREYVANQRAKDEAVVGVRSVLSMVHVLDGLDPGWLQLVKFHNGALALAEYAGAVAELRMARFGRDSAWRTMATLGGLDEIRHTQIPLLLGHDMLGFDGNFDWTHRAYHTNEWLMIAARHLFDDMFLAADAVDIAIQLNFVFETGFSNLQFMAMAALADGADDHLFEKALASIQTDEGRGCPLASAVDESGPRHRDRRVGTQCVGRLRMGRPLESPRIGSDRGVRSGRGGGARLARSGGGGAGDRRGGVGRPAIRAGATVGLGNDRMSSWSRSRS